MKNKTIWILLITGMIIYSSINQISACSPDPTPTFEIRTSNVGRCFFDSYNETVSIDVVDFIKERDSSHYQDCENITLSQSDKIIFKQIIERFNKNLYLWEHIYIQEQSNQEYTNFLDAVEEKNSNRCDCDKFSNVSREGNWTIYKRSSSCSSICGPLPPKSCPSRIIHSLIPLIIMIIGFCIVLGLIIGLIFLVKFFIIKKPKNKKSSQGST